MLADGRRVPAGWLHRPRLHLAPGTFGVARLDGRDRIVWHYQALDEPRTFEIRYTLSGVAVAYDDVVDVNLNVWGDEWKVGLPRLTATLDAPGKVLRAWGNPVYVRGDVAIAGNGRAPARARRPGAPVRRAAGARPACGLHIDSGMT